MRDLKKESGLSVYLKDDFKLDLDIKLLGGEFSARTISDMKPVLKDKIEINNDPAYFMYRDVRERIDDEKIKGAHLRYDLTVVLPRMLGSEFNKTYGHYHPIKDGTDITYPEVYEVISGAALYLLQKMGRNEDELDEIYLVEVKSGEKIIMPPNFGHITINPLSAPLVMSNWVASEFSSDYELYEKNHGGGYYITKSQIPARQALQAGMAGGPNPPDAEVGIPHRAAHRDKSQINSNFQIAKNKHYKILPKLIKARPKELRQFGMNFGKPMYVDGCKSINKIRYLTYPESFARDLGPSSVFDF